MFKMLGLGRCSQIFLQGGNRCFSARKVFGHLSAYPLVTWNTKKEHDEVFSLVNKESWPTKGKFSLLA